MFRPWLNFAMLAVESQQVIWLRMSRLAAGGAVAQREAQRMITEKAVAGLRMAGHFAAGGGADGATTHYRRKVRANVRRLSRRT